ncbi:SH3 domain-containing protein C23A1.17-like [Hibiscus syriacus]|uniref:SH3 domain-containing protein C23A1.17-like n=1 Tax=Hibiscus syriacus TaxID=106335 RepID=UPI001921EFDD|nr:SH3 domain-containing protein C23A1.17-like [Hibiscus syriacus]
MKICYVGKATKIFTFIATVLGILGLVLGLGLFRHGLRKPHKCSGDSCPSSSIVFPSSFNTPPPPPPPVNGTFNQPPSPASSPPTADPTATASPSPPPPQFPPPPASTAVLAPPPNNHPSPVMVAPETDTHHSYLQQNYLPRLSSLSPLPTHHNAFFHTRQQTSVFLEANERTTKILGHKRKSEGHFRVKQFGRGTAGLQFSKESNNLYNLNSDKHPGLANKKIITIQSGGKDQSVLQATTKTKRQNKPSILFQESVMKKEFPRMVKAVKNHVKDNYYRPYLTKVALTRLSDVHRILKVDKSGVKKRNRQALKVRGRK